MFHLNVFVIRKEGFSRCEKGRGEFMNFVIHFAFTKQIRVS